MEKLEERKLIAQRRTSEMQSNGTIKDEPAGLRDFQSFLLAIRPILKKDDSNKIRVKIIRYLVHRINIIPDGFEVHFKVGESYVKTLTPKLTGLWDENSDKKNALVDLPSANALQFLRHFGSNTCLNGAP